MVRTVCAYAERHGGAGRLRDLGEVHLHRHAGSRAAGLRHRRRHRARHLHVAEAHLRGRLGWGNTSTTTGKRHPSVVSVGAMSLATEDKTTLKCISTCPLPCQLSPSRHHAGRRAVPDEIWLHRMRRPQVAHRLVRTLRGVRVQDLRLARRCCRALQAGQSALGLRVMLRAVAYELNNGKARALLGGCCVAEVGHLLGHMPAISVRRSAILDLGFRGRELLGRLCRRRCHCRLAPCLCGCRCLLHHGGLMCRCWAPASTMRADVGAL